MYVNVHECLIADKKTISKNSFTCLYPSY